NKLNVKEAIDFIAETWDYVNNMTIKNCWQKTGILLSVHDSEVAIASQYLESNIKINNNEIVMIIARMII
ncbi:6673_t:CDS:1, partial [Ambispora gerdemannii]